MRPDRFNKNTPADIGRFLNCRLPLAPLDYGKRVLVEKIDAKTDDYGKWIAVIL